MNHTTNSDFDAAKGAVESFRPEPEQDSNVASFAEQLDHRLQDALNKNNDSGLVEKGQTEEFSMESSGVNELRKDTGYKPSPDKEVDADAETDDPEPGQTQKRNQGDQQDDPLAA